MQAARMAVRAALTKAGEETPKSQQQPRTHDGHEQALWNLTGS